MKLEKTEGANHAVGEKNGQKIERREREREREKRERGRGGGGTTDT